MEKTIVIGAGPAGLSAGYELARAGRSVTVLEQDRVYVGGISRTVEYNGYRFDIGGHRFFSKSEEVEQFWTDVLSDEMIRRSRMSRIYYNRKFFNYPIQAVDAFRKLGLIYSGLSFASYMKARLFPRPNTRSFEDWIINNFGEKLYLTFFKTYTEKVWGMPCTEISADWAAQRIKGLSLFSLLKNMLNPQKSDPSNRKVIKTLIDSFRYPRLGPGQMWERTAEIIRGKDQSVLMGRDVKAVNWSDGGGFIVEARDAQGNLHQLDADNVISSMPLRTLVEGLKPEVPESVLTAARSLKYRDFLIVALIVDSPALFPDNWIYIHDPGVKVGRIQNFKNWSPDLVPNQEKTCLGMEYFCFKNDSLWKSSDEELIKLAERELKGLGLASTEAVDDGTVIRVPKAYPVYDEDYQRNVAIIRRFLEEKISRLQLTGRNGMHRYNNQDHAIMTGFFAARNIIEGQNRYDLWKVNQDAMYLEEVCEDENLSGGRAVPTRI